MAHGITIVVPVGPRITINNYVTCYTDKTISLTEAKEMHRLLGECIVKAEQLKTEMAVKA